MQVMPPIELEELLQLQMHSRKAKNTIFYPSYDQTILTSHSHFLSML